MAAVALHGGNGARAGRGSNKRDRVLRLVPRPPHDSVPPTALSPSYWCPTGPHGTHWPTVAAISASLQHAPIMRALQRCSCGRRRRVATSPPLATRARHESAVLGRASTVLDATRGRLSAREAAVCPLHSNALTPRTHERTRCAARQRPSEVCRHFAPVGHTCVT